ncbi:hypothetical protein CAEBREN_13012 [Caenorhabditis brenneri]|uniref:Cytochrome c oxidase subunit 4 n=1 Tax=Caenorhabditis brenneri TaxID=135651 RepID=G0NPG9_CAEBE|nr:hypothetical protein CAEBREN_03266 [Caenorhabditis brenneri]EGT59705.1 hypothetical protein CAEBREN_13012 [Caenorhabditis brenneri]
MMLPRLALRAVHTTSRLSGGQEFYWGPEKAAGRELVGYGANGDNIYQDRLDYWYPAIRFRKEDSVIAPIRAKEQADWKNLSAEEKKLLYRYSFRQTLSEFEAPTGYWKVIGAVILSVLGLCTYYAVLLNVYVYPELPPTFQNEYKEAQVERALVLEKGQFLGAPVKYDYENQKWKK